MKILVKNNDGESSIINVVKYFKLENNNYMLYTLNEADDSQYIKMYAIRVIEKENGIEGLELNNDESTKIVQYIRNYVTASMQNQPFDSNELDSTNLISITLNSKKAFNLNKEMANILMSNRETITSSEEVKETETFDEIPSQNKENFYEEVDLIEENRILKEENEALKNKINQICEIVKHQ